MSRLALLPFLALLALGCQTAAPSPTVVQPERTSVDLFDPFAVAEAWLTSPTGEHAARVEQWETRWIERIRCEQSAGACSALVMNDRADTLTVRIRLSEDGWQVF